MIWQLNKFHSSRSKIDLEEISSCEEILFLFELFLSKQPSGTCFTLKSWLLAMESKEIYWSIFSKGQVKTLET